MLGEKRAGGSYIGCCWRQSKSLVATYGIRAADAQGADTAPIDEAADDNDPTSHEVQLIGGQFRRFGRLFSGAGRHVTLLCAVGVLIPGSCRVAEVASVLRG